MPYPETIKYIKKQLDEGIKPERIRKALLEHGYQQEIVDKLMEKAGEPEPEKKSSGIELILKDVGIGIILLLVMGSLIYISFFSDSKIELLSPKPIKLNLDKLSPLELEENGVYISELEKYIQDKNYEFNELTWSYSGKKCINIEISEGSAIIRSVFLPKCPLEENIEFTVKNPDGEIASSILIIRIV